MDALTRAAQVVVDPLADTETLVPGGTLIVTVRTFLQPGTPVTVIGATVKAPAGWTVERSDEQEPDDNNPFARMFREKPTATARYRVTAPVDAALTQPYYLAEPRDGDKYRWPPGSPKAMPFASPLLVGDVTLQVGGERVAGDGLAVQLGGERVLVSQAVEFRLADRVRGELRRQINVVPPVAVGLDSPLLIVPLGSKPHQQVVVVRATSFSNQPVTGSLRLRMPKGWTSTPREAPFTLEDTGGQDIRPVHRDGTRIPDGGPPCRRGRGNARADRLFERCPDDCVSTHSNAQDLPASDRGGAGFRSESRAGACRVRHGKRRPGARRASSYGRGRDAARRGDARYRRPVALRSRSSSASARRRHGPTSRPSNARLLQYAARGGTLIVQYQQTDYVARPAPYPAAPPRGPAIHASRTRRRPSRSLRPDHPVFTFPNRITDRGLRRMGAGTESVRRSHVRSRGTCRCSGTSDPGEPSQRGGEVYARGWQGTVRLYRVRLVPAATGGRARRVPAVREPDQPAESNHSVT